MGKKNGSVIVKVGVYLRKSRSEDGTTADLQKHKDYLVEVCTRNGWMFELYEEIDSSQDINRPELQRLRRDIELGRIDTVMVHAVDRLSRKTRHFLEIIEDYFLENGVTKLYVKDQEYVLTDSNTITMLQLQATLSQSEYSFIVRRLGEGRKASAKKGVWSGRVVYGYRYDKGTKKHEIVESEKPVVRKICEMVLDGHPFLAIAEEINRLGYRTRKGNPFQIHNVKSIIQSPFIRGHVEVTWQDKATKVKEVTIAKNSHDAIITEGEYAQIQAIQHTRAENYNNLNTKPMHFLQGLLRCGKCGVPTVVQADGRTGRYYVRKCRGCGENYGCKINVVEDIIEVSLKSYAEEVKARIEVLANTNQSEITSSVLQRRKELGDAIKRLDSKETTLLDLLVDGTIPKEVYNQKITAMKVEKADLVQSLESIPTIDVGVVKKGVEGQLALIREYKYLSEEDRRRVLQLLYKRIEFKNTTKGGTPSIDFYPAE